MDFISAIYDIPIQNQEINESVENDCNRMSVLLNLHNSYDAGDIVNYEVYYDSQDPILAPTHISKEIIKDIIDLLYNILEIQLMDDEIKKFIIDESKYEDLIKLRNLLCEQSIYINGQNYNNFYEDYYKSCKSWYIQAKINDYVYGGIFSFWNEKNPDEMMIQGISKSLLFGILQLYFPEYNNKLPRLNTILETGIESLARRLGVKRIYVVPIGSQGGILEKHYGYKLINKVNNKVEYPCFHIFGYENRYSNDYSKIYVKEII